MVEFLVVWRCGCVLFWAEGGLLGRVAEVGLGGHREAVGDVGIFSRCGEVSLHLACSTYPGRLDSPSCAYKASTNGPVR